MIVQLSTRYSRKIAFVFYIVFCQFLLVPLKMNAEALYRARNATNYRPLYHSSSKSFGLSDWESVRHFQSNINSDVDHNPVVNAHIQKKARAFIGGPNQPEMSSFKSVGTNNLVNLFTGDFNYNIPLMDVGGYPLNVYYDGGITMEQEASWVGLGWNINPGCVNRNVRGTPDDFNGQDTLIQMQTMKPNKTWGLGIGADFELFGIKAPLNANLGVAFNNYLGPSLDLAVRGSASLSIGKLAGTEKTPAASAGLSIGIDINSRTGTSFTAHASLSGNANAQNNTASFGVGLSTSYNSRSGIKALQITEQAGLSYYDVKDKTNEKNEVLYRYQAGGHINPTLYSTSISFV
ncbi:MAG TPA: hypothetical protein VMT76_07120, partial [Puia sp.]|nr:hypothetical protein [Puia sp.]